MKREAIIWLSRRINDQIKERAGKSRRELIDASFLLSQQRTRYEIALRCNCFFPHAVVQFRLRTPLSPAATAVVSTHPAPENSQDQ